MKLVIDIHEGDYRYIKQLQSITMARGTCKTIQRDVINAIKKGIPYEENTCDEREKGNCPFYTARGDV